MDDIPFFGYIFLHVSPRKHRSRGDISLICQYYRLSPRYTTGYHTTIYPNQTPLYYMSDITARSGRDIFWIYL